MQISVISPNYFVGVDAPITVACFDAFENEDLSYSGSVQLNIASSALSSSSSVTVTLAQGSGTYTLVHEIPDTITLSLTLVGSPSIDSSSTQQIIFATGKPKENFRKRILPFHIRISVIAHIVT